MRLREALASHRSFPRFTWPATSTISQLSKPDHYIFMWSRADLGTEMRPLPETCNSPFVPIRNTFNSTALRKIQMQTTLAILAVRFFLWVNPERGGR
jgi:hypothetical protein